MDIGGHNEKKCTSLLAVGPFLLGNCLGWQNAVPKRDVEAYSTLELSEVLKGHRGLKRSDGSWFVLCFE